MIGPLVVVQTFARPVTRRTPFEGRFRQNPERSEGSSSASGSALAPEGIHPCDPAAVALGSRAPRHFVISASARWPARLGIEKTPAVNRCRPGFHRYVAWLGLAAMLLVAFMPTVSQLRAAFLAEVSPHTAHSLDS